MPKNSANKPFFGIYFSNFDINTTVSTWLDIHPEKVPTVYRDALKQNMANFMFILLTILETCPESGGGFVVAAFLEPNYDYFKYSYTFNAKGEIIAKADRHYTDRNQYETDRYKRIAMIKINTIIILYELRTVAYVNKTVVK